MKITESIFYTYILCDPRKAQPYKIPGLDVILPYQPFYVGKGNGDRVNQHCWGVMKNINDDITLNKRKVNPFKLRTIRKILVSGLKPFTYFVCENVSEVIAFENEILLISRIGRKDLGKGCLTNLTDGGEGPTGQIGHKAKECLLYDSNGVFIKVCNSLTDAGKIIGRSDKTVSQAVIRGTKCNNFIVLPYSDTYLQKITVPKRSVNSFKGKCSINYNKESSKALAKLSKSRLKPLLKIDRNNNVINEYESQKSAFLSNGKKKVTRSIKHKNFTREGVKFIYKSDFEKQLIAA